MVVHALLTKDSSPTPARIGLTVGKSVGNAVTRHRVSRQIRHVVAQDVDRLPPGATVVIRALPGSATATSETLTRDVRAALAGFLGTAPS